MGYALEIKHPVQELCPPTGGGGGGGYIQIIVGEYGISKYFITHTTETYQGGGNTYLQHSAISHFTIILIVATYMCVCCELCVEKFFRIGIMIN